MKLLLLKEIKDGIRNYRFLIILSVIIFFAILNPVMTKYVMPQIIKSQMGDLSEDFINSMIDTSQRGIIRAYISDVYEICLLVFIIVMSGLVSAEFKNKTITISRLSGKSSSKVILSKFIIISIFIFSTLALSNLTNYFYASMLFGKDMDNIKTILFSGTLQGIYFTFVLTLIIFIGSFLSKPMITGLASLIPIYGLPVAGKLLDIEKYLPWALARESANLSISPPAWLLSNILITASVMTLLIMISIARLDDVEFTGRRKS